MKDHLGIFFYIKLSEKLMGEKGKLNEILVFLPSKVKELESLVAPTMFARKLKDYGYGNTKFRYGNTKLETPVLVRSLKLSNLGHG